MSILEKILYSIFLTCRNIKETLLFPFRFIWRLLTKNEGQTLSLKRSDGGIWFWVFNTGISVHVYDIFLNSNDFSWGVLKDSFYIRIQLRTREDGWSINSDRYSIGFNDMGRFSKNLAEANNEFSTFNKLSEYQLAMHTFCAEQLLVSGIKKTN